MLKVLVVEDDKTTRDVLSTLLGFEGCEVAAAPDGESALAVAEVMRPDVVLLDVMMPGMSGFAVCRALKDGDRIPRVVMVTAKTSPDDEEAGFAAGADAYLRKPFSPLEVLEAVGIETTKERR